MGRGKYYCHYCDSYIEHYSSWQRKSHYKGKKHRINVRFYYEDFVEEEAQKLIDTTTSAYKEGKIYPGMTIDTWPFCTLAGSIPAPMLSLMMPPQLPTMPVMNLMAVHPMVPMCPPVLPGPPPFPGIVMKP